MKRIDIEPTVCACGNHAFAPITRGLTTMVSPEDAHLLRRKWMAIPFSRRVQVRRTVKQRQIYLSRVVMQPPSGMYVDHINCDPTDNRRSNLRICTPGQNARNTRKKSGSKIPYKGVVKNRQGRFQARIQTDGVRIQIGTFDTPEAAAEAYRVAALQHHGEFARAT